MKRIEAKELIGQKLTVRDLMRIMDDIDVYDNVCEELEITFCNPFDDDEVHEWNEYLTEEAMNTFGDVLDYPMHINQYYSACAVVEEENMTCAVVEIDDDDDKVWKKRLRKAKEFFESAAGYCSCEDYDKWFKM